MARAPLNAYKPYGSKNVSKLLINGSRLLNAYKPVPVQTLIVEPAVQNLREDIEEPVCRVG